MKRRQATPRPKWERVIHAGILQTQFFRFPMFYPRDFGAPSSRQVWLHPARFRRGLSVVCRLACGMLTVLQNASDSPCLSHGAPKLPEKNGFLLAPLLRRCSSCLRHAHPLARSEPKMLFRGSDTPEVFGGLKTRLFEGPKLIGSVWVRKMQATLQVSKQGLNRQLLRTESRTSELF